MLKRIMIFGRPGSGKSTFATWLSRSLGLPLHHLDKHFYINNWVERDYQEFLQIQKTIVSTDYWIIDGNNTKSLESRFSQADLVLYFNFPKFICYLRVIKRFLNQNSPFDDRASGCKETLRYSLLKYMWHFEKNVAYEINRLKKRYPQVVFKEIRCDQNLDHLKHDVLNKNDWLNIT